MLNLTSVQGPLCETHQQEPCLLDSTPIYPRRKPTRQERLQELADSGVDTWEEYRGEK